jgi:hypothetical protein
MIECSSRRARVAPLAVPRARRATVCRVLCAGQSAPQTVRQFVAMTRQCARDALAGARRIVREAGAELARLNRAGLSADALAGKSRSARARIVSAMLAQRHDGHHRCC